MNCPKWQFSLFCVPPSPAPLSGVGRGIGSTALLRLLVELPCPPPEGGKGPFQSVHRAHSRVALVVFSGHVAALTWPPSRGRPHVATLTWPPSPGRPHLAALTWPPSGGRPDLTAIVSARFDRLLVSLWICVRVNFWPSKIFVGNLASWRTSSRREGLFIGGYN